MPVQQVLRMPAHGNIKRIEQALEITVLIERRAHVRHHDVPHEHHSFFGKMNQHGVWSFSASSRDELDFRSSDVQVRSTVDGNVRSVAHNGLVVESLSEERFREGLWSTEFPVELFLIIPPSIELRTRVQTSKIRMTADVIPVSLGH